MSNKRRVKELSRQAVIAMRAEKNDLPPLEEVVLQKILELRTEYDKKFAELIVKECMTIAKNWEDQLEKANSLNESDAVGIVAYRIARQFGVKE
jgi:hypothetical protein